MTKLFYQLKVENFSANKSNWHHPSHRGKIQTIFVTMLHNKATEWLIYSIYEISEFKPFMGSQLTMLMRAMAKVARVMMTNFMVTLAASKYCLLVDDQQCYQMTRLFCNIWPFTAINICAKVSQERFPEPNIAKFFKYLTKWWNFAKSGHTDDQLGAWLVKGMFMHLWYVNPKWQKLFFF